MTGQTIRVPEPILPPQLRIATPAPGARTNDVLVVDDEIDIALFVAEALRDEGYSVRVQHDGASALVDIVRRPPGLVLLDIAMPVMIGDEVLRQLRRSEFADLPVVVMTASLTPERYRSCGATTVLAKPFDLDELVALVERMLPLVPAGARA